MVAPYGEIIKLQVVFVENKNQSLVEDERLPVDAV
jgi:hypothetical protein